MQTKRTRQRLATSAPTQSSVGANVRRLKSIRTKKCLSLVTSTPTRKGGSLGAALPTQLERDTLLTPLRVAELVGGPEMDERRPPHARRRNREKRGRIIGNPGCWGGDRGAWSRFWGKSSKNWGLGLRNWAGVKRNSVGVNGNSLGVKEIWGGVNRNWVGVNRNSTPDNGNWRGVAANSLAGNRNSVPDHRNWVTGKENSASHNRNSTAKTDDGVSVRENAAGFDVLFRAARSLPNPTYQVTAFNCCCRGCRTWAGGRNARR